MEFLTALLHHLQYSLHTIVQAYLYGYSVEKKTIPFFHQEKNLEPLHNMDAKSIALEHRHFRQPRRVRRAPVGAGDGHAVRAPVPTATTVDLSRHRSSFRHNKIYSGLVSIIH